MNKFLLDFKNKIINFNLNVKYNIDNYLDFFWGEKRKRGKEKRRENGKGKYNTIVNVV